MKAVQENAGNAGKCRQWEKGRGEKADGKGRWGKVEGKVSGLKGIQWEKGSVVK